MLNNKPKLRAASRAMLSIIDKESASLGMLPEELFVRMLQVERKRTERSGRRFVLMLVDPGTLLKSAAREQVLTNLISAVMQSTRDTDLKGWYRDGAVVGVIFTEIGDGEDKSVVHSISTKITDAFYDALSVPQVNHIRLSFHVFPEDWDDEQSMAGPATSTLSLSLTGAQKDAALRIKRLVDIAGSLAALIIGMPLFITIALAVKLTSKGPALFQQVRLGQHGKKFMFLKFRSMYVSNDHSIHEEYVKSFIAGQADRHPVADQRTPYKMVADPRVTLVGRVLRKTSLDELPQFINVLKGDMSLVGPRPPVTYEFERYQLWHKQRLLAVKPGLTGLWQVEGRSRVTFDDMVRLDIRYARSWSLWLDFKILLQTPRAVVKGEGAC